MRREERVTVQGPVKEQQPDGMSHGVDPPPQCDLSGKQRNHLEERLFDQAQARASYTPPFGGCSRNIPQVVVSDVPAPGTPGRPLCGT